MQVELLGRLGCKSRNRISVFFCMVFLFNISVVAVECKHNYENTDISNYYASAIGLEGDALRSQLNKIIQGHTKYSYSCVWKILEESDEDPNDRTDEGSVGSIITLYTGRSIKKSKRDRRCPSSEICDHLGNCERCIANDPNSWNREHVWSKSHGFPRKRQHAYTDVHHIRAVDRSVNTDRSDHDFAEGGMTDDECLGCKEGVGTWEPPDEVKGDIARMMFYMDVRYEGNDSSGTPNLVLVNKVDTDRANETALRAEFGHLCTLYKWHVDDGVSDEERNRNNIIERWQGNRNPFIDRPEFVQKIWSRDCMNI